MLWKEVVEYIEQHPTASITDVANAIGIDSDLAKYYMEEWKNNHREAVIMSKSI